MLESVRFLTVTLALLCVVEWSTQCSPAPGYVFPTVEERVQRAPIVVRGYLVRRIGNINFFTACLYLSHTYKGYVRSKYICARGFGSSAACKTELSYGVDYLIFLKRNPWGGYAANEVGISSAAVRFSGKVYREIKNGLCCPRKLGRCYSGRIGCSSRSSCRPAQCGCRKYFKG